MTEKEYKQDINILGEVRNEKGNLYPLGLFSMPSVYPTATTIYKPGKCFNAFTILAGEEELRDAGDK
jgi:hypothetical protein